MDLLTSIFKGEFDLAALRSLLSGIWGAHSATVVSFLSSTPVAIALIAIGFVSLLYGRRFIGPARFIVCAAGGFAPGVVVVSPLVNQLFPIAGMYPGFVLALLCAVLAKYLYYAFVYSGIAVLTFILIFPSTSLPIPLPTNGNHILTAVVIVVLIVVAIVTRRDIDRIVTAVAGATFIAYGAKKIFDYTVFAPEYKDFIILGLILALTIFGFDYQFKRRKRYY